MKQKSLLFVLLLLLCMGMANAKVVQVGSGYDYTRSLPTSTSKYHVSQQIYTAAEIGYAGSITRLAFYHGYINMIGDYDRRAVDVYLTQTSKSSFSGEDDWVSVSQSDLVYSDTMEIVRQSWVILTLDNPFFYNGRGNLCVTVVDKTGKTGIYPKWYAIDASNQAKAMYSDNHPFDATKLSSYTDSRETYDQKNQIRIYFKDNPVDNPNIVEIGEPTSNAKFNSLPVSMQFTYSMTQVIYTPSQIGTWGKIKSIAYEYCYDQPVSVEGVQIYMMHTEKEGFKSAQEYVPYEQGTKVWEGTFTCEEPGWVTITLDTPFDFNGTDNLLVCVIDPYRASVTDQPPTNNWNDYGFRQTYRMVSSKYPSLTFGNFMSFTDLMDFDASVSVRATVNRFPNTRFDIESPFIKIGSGTATNNYLPTNTNYCNSISQQIYTKEEIGDVETLNSVSFFNEGEDVTRNIDIYLVPTDKTSFEGSDWISLSPTLNKVFSGEVTFEKGKWTAIGFNKSWWYDKTRNLALVVDDNTGTFLEDGTSFRVFEAPNQALCGASDVEDFDVNDVANYGGSPLSVKNQIRFNERYLDIRPTNLYAKSVFYHIASITWDGEGSKWNFQYKRRDAEEWTEINGLTNNLYTLTNLDMGTCYDVRVQIVYGSGKVSGWSTTHFTTKEYPKPTNLEVYEVSSFSAMCSWQENGEAQSWQICLNGDTITTSRNPILLTGLDQDTEYEAKIRSVINAEKGIYTFWSDVCHFTTPLVNPAPTDVAVVETTPTTATIKWEGISERYQVRYKKRDEAGNATFFDDFETGNLLNNWAVCTTGQSPYSDGWLCSSTTPGGAHSGNYSAIAWSWKENVSYDADNWLLSPTLDLGGTLKFWVKGDVGYPDYFEVLLSTVSRFSTSAYTTTLRPMSATPGTWTEVVIDLSAYAGQTGWIAIHHVYEDGNFIAIDDFGIYTTSNLEWAVAETKDKTVTLTDLEPSSTYDFEVVGIMKGQEDASARMASFTTMEANPVPTDIAVRPIDKNSVKVTWKGFGDSYIVYYRTAGADGAFFDGFEGSLSQWTILTEGTSSGWVREEATPANPAYQGSFMACSKSWVNGTPYNADNWLITPRLNVMHSELSFWERASDPQYPDQFEVLLSHTGNTIEDFADAVVLRPMQPASSDWSKVTINLGTRNLSDTRLGYIAIHHKDYDKHHLHIDDFCLEGARDVEAGEWESLSTSEPSVTIDQLNKNTMYEFYIVSLKDGEPDATTDISTFITPSADPLDLVMYDNGDNRNLISSTDGSFANVTIENLTFEDDVWQSICLPFDLKLKGSLFDGVDVRTAENMRMEGNTIVIDCITPITEMKAGTPYIMRWNKGYNLSDPVFEGVKINAQQNEVKVGDVRFLPAQYYYWVNTTNSPNFYVFRGLPGESGLRLSYSRLEDEQKAFHPFFYIPDYHGIDGMRICIGEEDDEVKITSTLADEEEVTIYNLAGQRLSKKQKGINIVRGRKVLVK